MLQFDRRILCLWRKLDKYTAPPLCEGQYLCWGSVFDQEGRAVERFPVQLGQIVSTSRVMSGISA
jgi:hypothetical protein